MPQIWQQELASAYTSVDALLHDDLLNQEEAVYLRNTAAHYQIRVPRYYAQLIDRSNLQQCPIRLQALPSLLERQPIIWPAWAKDWSQQAFGRDEPWHTDPIGDITWMAAPRLTHRYHNRAIMHVSAACALYCRFCFRKSHLNDAERTLYHGSLQPALQYIHDNPNIEEVILTGGDPLAVTDAFLKKLFIALCDIPHIQHIRMHSRMLTTLPSRFTEALIDIFKHHRLTITLVSHFNHPREITAEALHIIQQLRRAGVVLYNQSVLLRHINHHDHILCKLWQQLYNHGMSTFYLHHADWVPDTFYFRMPITEGQALMQGLQGRLSGPAMPDYVLDVPGGFGKVSLLGGSIACIARKLDHDTNIGGALYRITHVQTRQSASATSIYADYWPLK